MNEYLTEISFPSLGLTMDPSRSFSIGSLEIHWYGVLIALGMLLAVVYACRRCKHFGLTDNDLIDGVLWIVPTVFYLLSLFLWGYGFRYARAWPIEKVFIGFIGLCEPFQNPLIGMLIGMGILFAFHYIGRRYSHHYWQEHRIRR
jgi:prolipoprotein diacylglyceryltransferase